MESTRSTLTPRRIAGYCDLRLSPLLDGDPALWHLQPLDRKGGDQGPTAPEAGKGGKQSLAIGALDDP